MLLRLPNPSTSLQAENNRGIQKINKELSSKGKAELLNVISGYKDTFAQNMLQLTDTKHFEIK
ncbi:hypothetical protein PR048_009273 [Dryococelus australis]|uniref:Uncharacterized protein n=1 Tax=Dryococelus australis TaxID=614101 RepID=A0ABQ9HZH4_9NEOP|nr:hypothetical protein PR048_009273 [Dryococelus australis]